MKLSHGPERFNEIANHPRVFPYVSQAGDSAVDLGPNWERCIGTEFEDGGWVYYDHGCGVWEIHTLFLPKPTDVATKLRESLGHIFGQVGAATVITQIPRDLPHARRLAVNAKFEHIGSKDDGWLRESGPVALDFYQLTQEAWQGRQGCPSQDS